MVGVVSVAAHEKALRQMPCALTGSPFVTLHHCRGGSMDDLGWRVAMSKKQNPFLQIPLNGVYHVGQFGIDSGMGAKRWEQKFLPQVELLELVNGRLPYDVWEQALMWHARFRANTKPGRRP